uniref:Uncharacterized protein n=1 Tax=Sphaerodactylus townsendi TaxID=933632 RepID=A0ACB8EK42_9SAUR
MDQHASPPRFLWSWGQRGFNKDKIRLGVLPLGVHKTSPRILLMAGSQAHARCTQPRRNAQLSTLLQNDRESRQSHAIEPRWAERARKSPTEHRARDWKGGERSPAPPASCSPSELLRARTFPQPQSCSRCNGSRAFKLAILNRSPKKRRERPSAPGGHSSLWLADFISSPEPEGLQAPSSKPAALRSGMEKARSPGQQLRPFPLPDVSAPYLPLHWAAGLGAALSAKFAAQTLLPTDSAKLQRGESSNLSSRKGVKAASSPSPRHLARQDQRLTCRPALRDVTGVFAYSTQSLTPVRASERRWGRGRGEEAASSDPLKTCWPRANRAAELTLPHCITGVFEEARSSGFTLVQGWLKLQP